MVDCVTCRRSAAVRKLPLSTTSRNVRARTIFMNLSRDHINFFDLAYFVLPIYAKGEWDPGKKSGSFACQVKCPSIVLEQQGTSSAGTARALGSGNDDVCWAVIPCGMLSNMPAVAICQAGLEPDDVRGRVECSNPIILRRRARRTSSRTRQIRGGVKEVFTSQ